jgi:TatD DNase family protein
MGRRRWPAAHRYGQPDLPAHRGGGAGLSRRGRPDRLPGLVDAHCHLQHDRFDADRDAVLERAAAAGIERVLVPGWDLRSSEAALALAERHRPLVQAAVGVHPHDAVATSEAEWRALEALMADPRCAAVGEIGLDYHRNLSPPDAQRAALARQLAAAAALGRPVVIHDRESHADVEAALIAWDGRPQRDARGMLHAFSGDSAMAERLTAIGFLVSFAFPVAFRSASGPRAAAGTVASGSYLVETDGPYLGPGRDARNEPTTALRVAAELATLRGVTPERVSADARRAYERLIAP